MSFQNAQFKNIGNDEGDVLDFFNDTLRNLVQKNGGDNTFSFVTEEFDNKNAPMPIGSKTRMKLTHSGHTISQIEKGFINMKIAFKVKFQDEIEEDAFALDTEGLNRIFIGFKDAVEIIEDCRFWVDGKLVDTYRQDQMIRESFAYNAIRAKDVKIASPKAHSLWEKVSKYLPGVCGVYIPLKKFENGAVVEVKMELIIPFTDQLALQAWRLYPNRILGEIEEEIRTSLEGLVWCQIDPIAVADVLRFMDYNQDALYYSPTTCPITAHFVQIDRPAKIVIGIEEKNEDDQDLGDGLITFNAFSNKPGKTNVWTLKNNTLQLASNGTIYIARTNCAGFGVKHDVVLGLMETLKEPIIIPAQELTREIFEGSPSPSGLEVSKSIPLRNATNITMMFPRNSKDCTVFQNVMYKKCQLTVNKKQYPDTEFDTTTDGRFVQYQLIANELDGYIEATDEFVRSISLPLNKSIENGGLRYKSTSAADNTSFGINFQLERGNAGYVFDGIDTGSQSITITFKGLPMHDGINDTYYYPEVDDVGKPLEDYHPPQPEMWICSDTYWTWSLNDGVQYYSRGVPNGYE